MNLFICALILAICLLLNKQALNIFSSHQFQFINSIISFCFVPIWYNLSNNFPNFQIYWKNYIFLILASLLSILGFVFYLNGLKETTPTIAGTVLSTYPSIAFLISCLIGIEQFNITKLIGLIIVIIGIYLIRF